MSFLGDFQSSLGSYVEVYGLVGLFIATLLGGTLVPLSCDAFAVLALGIGLPLIPVIIVASLGTAFGGLSTFFVGRAGSDGRRGRTRTRPAEGAGEVREQEAQAVGPLHRPGPPPREGT